MQCPYCSDNHPDNAQFCPRTGKTLPVQQNTSKRFYVGLRILSALLMVISLFMLLTSNGISANSEAIRNPTAQTNAQPTSQQSSSTSKPTSTSLPTPTSTPHLIRTSIPQNNSTAQISCANNLYKVNLRRTPGYTNKSVSDSIYEIPCGEYLELLGDTQNVDGLKWWRVKWNGYTGWIADQTAGGKTILIFNP